MPVQLVLLPGLDGTGLLFRDFVKALPAEVETTVYRYPSTPMTYAALADFVVERLPSEGPLFVLGESFSGPVAIQVAAREPRVRGVILCTTFARRPWPLPAWLARCAPVPDSARLMGWLVGSFIGWPGRREDRLLFAEALRLTPKATMRFRLEQVLNVDVTAALAGLRMPILTLRASQDRLVPRNELPDAVTLEGSHFLLQDNPVAAANAVVRFIQEQVIQDYGGISSVPSGEST